MYTKLLKKFTNGGSHLSKRELAAADDNEKV